MAAPEPRLFTNKQRVLLGFSAACLFVFAMGCHNSHRADIGDLAGLWQTQDNVLFYEQWTVVNDSVLQGKGYSLNGTDTLFSENIRIAPANGLLTYYAQAGQQNMGQTIAFSLVKHTRNSWIFENPEHDYPNRISYTLLSDSILDARIENMRGNKAQNFHFKRIR